MNMMEMLVGCFFIAAYKAALDGSITEHCLAYRVVCDLEREYPRLLNPANYYDVARWEGR